MTPGELGMMPCEERLVVDHDRQRLTIGVPAEPDPDENRVPLTPQAVELLVADGHHVLVQRGAGYAARFDDEAYAAAGAEMVDSPLHIFQANAVVRVSPLRASEAQMLGPDTAIVTCVGRHERSTTDWQALAQRDATLLAIDLVADNGIPIVSRSLGEVEGTLAISAAAALLDATDGGKGVVLGAVTGVPPTEVLIVGSDTAAVCAARSAQAIGCAVRVFDRDHLQLQQFQLLVLHRVDTSTLHPQALNKALRSADVLLLTRHRHDQLPWMAPRITAEQLDLLKRDAVVVDLDAIDGGRSERTHATTLQQPYYRASGALYHALPDITCLAPHTASIVLSDVVTPLLQTVADLGGLDAAIRASQRVQQAVALYQGTCTNRYLALKADAECYDIRLLIA